MYSVLESGKIVVAGLIEFIKSHGNTNKGVKNEAVQSQTNVPRYKVSLCRDLVMRGTCPRGGGCTFAHSEEELEKQVLHAFNLFCLFILFVCLYSGIGIRIAKILELYH